MYMLEELKKGTIHV